MVTALEYTIRMLSHHSSMTKFLASAFAVSCMANIYKRSLNSKQPNC